MSCSTYKLQPAVRVEKCDHRSRELVVRGDKKATTLEGFQIRISFLIKTKIWSEYVSWIKYLQNRLLPGRDRQQTPWTTPRTKHPKNSTSPKELMCLKTNHKLVGNLLRYLKYPCGAPKNTWSTHVGPLSWNCPQTLFRQVFDLQLRHQMADNSESYLTYFPVKD